MTIGYRLETDGAALVILTDHEPFSETLWRADSGRGRIESILHEGDRRHARFMANADLVIHDAQYTPEEYSRKKNWGHSTYPYVVEMAAAAGVRRLALTHHDPTHSDQFVEELERDAQQLARDRGAPLEVFCAYEGLEIDLEPPDIPSGEFIGPGHSQSTLTTARILVADDDQDMRALARRVLERDGHSVIEATDGADALRIARETPLDLVILDIVMPSLGGLEVLEAIRSRPETAALPVLILTSMDDEASTRRGFDSGASDYLTKPYSMPQLSARVRSLLARFKVR
jgi:CheY-like chemotaxis protein